MPIQTVGEERYCELVDDLILPKGWRKAAEWRLLAELGERKFRAMPKIKWGGQEALILRKGWRTVGTPWLMEANLCGWVFNELPHTIWLNPCLLEDPVQVAHTTSHENEHVYQIENFGLAQPGTESYREREIRSARWARYMDTKYGEREAKALASFERMAA